MPGETAQPMFEALYSTRHQIGLRLRREGRHVFGCLSNYVPEEILHAAGVVPVRLRGRGKSLQKIGKYLAPNTCSYLKGCANEGLLGEYDYLDGFVAARSCDAIRNLFGIWVELMKPAYSFYVSIPTRNTPESRSYYAKELSSFRNSLEGHLGKSIPEESIRRSIGVYNRNREYLAKMQQMRLDGSLRLSGSEFHGMLMSGFVMPKEEHNRHLENYMSVAETTASRTGSIPLALTGTTFEDFTLLRLVERHGGDVVLEDTSLGRPYYGKAVAESGDAVQSLADRYLTMPAAPYQCGSHDRIHRLVEDVKRYKIAGVINVVQKYCDEYLMENVPLLEELKKEDIPCLYLDMDDTSADGGPLNTRIQAFLEILGDRHGRG